MNLSGGEIIKIVIVSTYLFLCVSLLVKFLIAGTKTWILMLTPVFPLITLLVSCSLTLSIHRQHIRDNSNAKLNIIKLAAFPFMLFPTMAGLLNDMFVRITNNIAHNEYSFEKNDFGKFTVELKKLINHTS